MTRRDFLKKFGLVVGALALGGGAWLFHLLNRTKELPLVDAPWQPAYLKLDRAGLLAARVEEAYAIFTNCRLCPRRCGVNRSIGETGFCLATAEARVHSYGPHFGEEHPLVGRGGSGTIFFSKCNLRCVFCQNYPIAHHGFGMDISDERLAGMMLALQRNGCHNINLVTPTHMMPNILNAIQLAQQQGLRLPICYNTSGYELPEIVNLLDGVVDIYLPDIKFMDGAQAARYNLAEAYDYPQYAKASTIAMHGQVGELVLDERGIARRGLMVRHLVMPNRVAGTRELVQWIATSLSPNTYVNIMDQYRVAFKAFEPGFETIGRAISSAEFVESMQWAQEAGLTNLDQRSLSRLLLHERRIR